MYAALALMGLQVFEQSAVGTRMCAAKASRALTSGHTKLYDFLLPQMSSGM
jgi:hypothetical protein